MRERTIERDHDGLLPSSIIAATWTCMLAAAILSSPKAHAQEQLQFSDCSSTAMKAVKRRIFEVDGRRLRHLVYSRDVLHLSICEGEGPRLTYARIAQRLREKYVLENADITNSSDGYRLPALDACIPLKMGQDCKVELYRLKGMDLPKDIPFAKSGGLPFAAVMGHAGDKGHYELTGRGAELAAKDWDIRWSSSALAMMKDGARDPDFYEWGNPSAHAQTANDDASGELQIDDIPIARRKFIAWSAKYLNRSVKLCEDGDPAAALYLLGYSLHGLQDLVFHEGISNAEHSFRDFIEEAHMDDDAGPFYARNMSLATHATASFLMQYRLHVLQRSAKCWKRMVSYSGAAGLSTARKESLLGKNGKDFGLKAYWDYKKLSVTVRDGIDEKGIPGDRFFIKKKWLAERKSALLDEVVSQLVNQLEAKP